MKRILVGVAGGVVQEILGDPVVEVFVLDWDSDGSGANTVWITTDGCSVSCDVTRWTPEPLPPASDAERVVCAYLEKTCPRS